MTAGKMLITPLRDVKRRFAERSSAHARRENRYDSGDEEGERHDYHRIVLQSGNKSRKQDEQNADTEYSHEADGSPVLSLVWRKHIV